MSTRIYPHLDNGFVRRLFWARTFGLFLRELRNQKGKSIEEAARRAGMETHEWQAIEKGYPPEPAHLDQMAVALEVDPNVISGLVTFCSDGWDDG